MPQAQLFRSKARHLSKEWVAGVAPQPPPQKTHPGFRRPRGLCTGNLIMARELSLWRNAQDMANSGVLRGLGCCMASGIDRIEAFERTKPVSSR